MELDLVSVAIVVLDAARVNHAKNHNMNPKGGKSKV
jgi:hypothetical protein